MPYSCSLGGWLRVLDLRGTRDLHIFNSHLQEGANWLKDQAFFVLRNASFHYHSHCCQLKRSNYSYLEQPTTRMYTSTCQTDIFPLNEMRFRLGEDSTMCTPLEDAFNPCEDLLGRGYTIRSFIWITIILALVGNFLSSLFFLAIL